jgi:hypothetical protein
MKKRTLKGRREPLQEIVSFNDELFSFVTGDPLAALDEQLAMVEGGGITCREFSCASFGCASFSCETFRPI